MSGLDRRARRAWLAVMLCIALIWILSGESFSADATEGLLGSLLRWIHPEISWPALVRAHTLARKAAHLTEYAVLAVLSFRALRLSVDVSTPRVVGLAMTLVIVVAALDELRQSFLATRTGSLADVAIDFTGGTLGVALIIALHRRLGIGAPAPEKDA